MKINAQNFTNLSSEDENRNSIKNINHKTYMSSRMYQMDPLNKITEFRTLCPVAWITEPAMDSRFDFSYILRTV